MALASKPWEGKSQDADGKGREGSSSAMTGFAPRDLHKSADGGSVAASPEGETEEITQRKGQEKAGEPRSWIVTVEDQAPNAQMSFPVSKPLFNGHPFGIEVDDLLGGQGDLPRDQQIPGVLIPFPAEDDQPQRDLSPGMIKNGITFDLADRHGEPA